MPPVRSDPSDDQSMQRIPLARTKKERKREVEEIIIIIKRVSVFYFADM